MMRSALLAALSAFLLSPAVFAWNRGEATTFARLPQAQRNPEGLALDRTNGDVYAADFDISRAGKAGQVGQVVVFNREGKLLRVLNVANSSPLLLGLDFHPMTHALLVLDFGNQQVLEVDRLTGQSKVFATVTSKAGSSGLNALTFDAHGNVYVSDSFLGIIWTTGPGGGKASIWVQDDLLKPQGKPPFGANGIAFNNDAAHKAMFVANTANDTIIRVPVKSDGSAGAPEEFTNSINGADGLAIDEDDNIWVCANQSDELVVVDKTGKAIAKLGDFNGISERGEPRGFLFPASLVFSGEFVLVTNLSLDTSAFGFQTVDTGWSQQVKTFTLSKIKRRIPPVHDD